MLKPLVNDDHPRVRLEAVRALSFMNGDEAIELALEVLEYEMDYYLQYTLDETMRSLENRIAVYVIKEDAHRAVFWCWLTFGKLKSWKSPIVD